MSNSVTNAEAPITKTERKLGYLPGKYSQPAVYLYGRLQYYFDLSKPMAHVAAEAFMSDAGRAQCEVEGVKIGKAKKDGAVKWSESGETALAETYAMRMYRACTALDKVSKETGIDATSLKHSVGLHELCNDWLAEKTAQALTKFDFVETLTEKN